MPSSGSGLPGGRSGGQRPQQPVQLAGGRLEVQPGRSEEAQGRRAAAAPVGRGEHVGGAFQPTTRGVFGQREGVLGIEHHHRSAARRASSASTRRDVGPQMLGQLGGADPELLEDASHRCGAALDRLARHGLLGRCREVRLLAPVAQRQTDAAAGKVGTERQPARIGGGDRRAKVGQGAGEATWSSVRLGKELGQQLQRGALDDARDLR